MNPSSLFIAAALFIALIAGVNFGSAPSSDAPIFTAAGMSGGSSGDAHGGGGGW